MIRRAVGPFRGSGTGLTDRFHHMEDPGRNFSFNIDENGIVRGRGQGVYDSATWHLEGSKGSDGAFNCDVIVRTPANYVVDISGEVVDGNARVRFELVGAEEENSEAPCGGNYTAFETHSTYFATSLCATSRRPTRSR